MNNPKADAALNLSLSLPESLHEKSTSLSAVLTGSVWEILVLASQDLSFQQNSTLKSRSQCFLKILHCLGCHHH